MATGTRRRWVPRDWWWPSGDRRGSGAAIDGEGGATILLLSAFDLKEPAVKANRGGGGWDARCGMTPRETREGGEQRWMGAAARRDEGMERWRRQLNGGRWIRRATWVRSLTGGGVVVAVRATDLGVAAAIGKEERKE
uniref:DUF834 domain-containing protein n=1 Tax=Oryza punctata TaxID=4537 RepID=A0A0E0M3A8_ORYPU